MLSKLILNSIIGKKIEVKGKKKLMQARQVKIRYNQMSFGRREKKKIGEHFYDNILRWVVFSCTRRPLNA